MIPSPVPTARCENQVNVLCQLCRGYPKPNGVFCRYCSGAPYPNQPLSTLPRPVPVSAQYQRPKPQSGSPQPMMTIRHQGWGTPLQGVLMKPSHENKWQLKLLSLGNNSSSPKKPWRMFGTVMVLRFDHTRVNWSP